jgi:ArsR family transcriptional regulator, arsenate/arsenite/antimonite-responsive transcriptional repressor / arsenate reductase (thioredoxin)
MNTFENDPTFTVSSDDEPTVAPSTPSTQRQEWHFVGPPVRVLFLCTNNSARSQMAEALLRTISQGQVEAYSAGSQPAATVYPEATQAIARLGADMSQYVPKHYEQFQGQSFDRVIILCDREQETCPTFPDEAVIIYWNIPDPVAVEGSEEERSRAFRQLALELNTRVRLLLTLLERQRREG